MRRYVTAVDVGIPPVGVETRSRQPQLCSLEAAKPPSCDVEDEVGEVKREEVLCKAR